MINSRKKAAEKTAFLKKEAIKALASIGVYDGPDKIVSKNDKLDPKKDRIKTEIKMSAKKLNNFISDNNDLADDLGLGSIFSDVPDSSEEDIDTSAIDRIYSELEDDSSEEECECHKKDNKDIDDMDVDEEEELPIKEASSEDEDEVKDIGKEEAADEIEVAAAEEADIENEEKLSRIAARIRAYKFNEGLTEEDVEEIENAAESTNSPNIQARLTRLVKRIKGTGYQKRLHSENKETELPHEDKETVLRKIANELKSLKIACLNMEDDEGSEEEVSDEDADKIKEDEEDLDKNNMTAMSIDSSENIDRTIDQLFSEADKDASMDDENMESCACGKHKSVFEMDSDDDIIDTDEIDAEVKRICNLKEDEPLEGNEVSLARLHEDESEDELGNITIDSLMSDEPAESASMDEDLGDIKIDSLMSDEASDIEQDPELGDIKIDNLMNDEPENGDELGDITLEHLFEEASGDEFEEGLNPAADPEIELKSLFEDMSDEETIEINTDDAMV